MLRDDNNHGYHAAGFNDIRAAHADIFRLLPPEDCRITELIEQAYTSKQAMGYLVEYLEEHENLECAPDLTDGRAQIVRRTERQEVLSSFIPAILPATYAA